MILTPQQKQALKADIIASANPLCVALEAAPTNSDFAFAVAALYNIAASPNFWVWKGNLSAADTGTAIVMAEVGGLTTANSTRLQVSFQVRPNGFTPADQGDRSLFGTVFSAAGGVLTRAALLAKWQRPATVVEKLFSTGTGTQATGLNTDGTVTGGSPALMGSEGPLIYQDVLDAMAS